MKRAQALLIGCAEQLDHALGTERSQLRQRHATARVHVTDGRPGSAINGADFAVPEESDKHLHGRSYSRCHRLWPWFVSDLQQRAAGPEAGFGELCVEAGHAAA